VSQKNCAILIFTVTLIIFISPIKRQQTTYTQIKADRTQTQT